MLTDTIQSNFDRSLQFLIDHNIGPSEFVIVGSSALYYLGLLEFKEDEHPSDIDILIKDPHKFEELKRVFPSARHNINAVTGETVDIKEEDISLLPLELTQEWPTHGINSQDIFRHHIDRNGLQVMSPQDSELSMREFNRPKDQRRLFAIQNADDTIELDI